MNEAKKEATTNILTNIVKSAKERARDILRAQAVNGQKTAITELKTQKTNLEKEIEKPTKEVARAEYKLSKIDEANPDFEVLKENAETSVKAAKENLETMEKYVKKESEKMDKKVTERNEKITKWETGETMVSLEAMTDLTNKIIEDKG